MCFHKQYQTNCPSNSKWKRQTVPPQTMSTNIKPKALQVQHKQAHPQFYVTDAFDTPLLGRGLCAAWPHQKICDSTCHAPRKSYSSAMNLCLKVCVSRPATHPHWSKSPSYCSWLKETLEIQEQKFFNPQEEIEIQADTSKDGSNQSLFVTCTEYNRLQWNAYLQALTYSALMQGQQPIALASRAVSGAEQNYGHIEK